MLPKDPIMLMSVINTRLRDTYCDLDALCDDLDIPKEELENTLGNAGYVYDERLNRFAGKAHET